MSIYLDNSATTRPYKEVIETMVSFLSEDFQNPSAAYRDGLNIERKIKKARDDIAITLGARADEIIFTSGGTESNNQIIKGVARYSRARKKHLITSQIEHPSVLNSFYDLEREGFDITVLGVDKNGRIDIDELKSALREDTCLVSMMHVNNEIGVIADIKEISKVIKSFNKDIVFHVDAVQSYGKLRFTVDELGIDALSASGHKIHGPKGIGLLYVRRGVEFSPLISGGGQERGLRSGTENVAGIMGLAKAVEILFNGLDEKIEHIKKYRDTLKNKILDEIEGVRINSFDDGVCHILNVSFLGIKGEVLLHFLENDDISVSTGSACSAKKPGSRVLKALKLSDDALEGAVRFSISEDNNMDEIYEVVGKIKTHLTRIRKISGYR